MKLELYYPIKPLYVTQKFGEIANLAYYKANGINFAGHNGIDMLAHHGQPIYAAHDGMAYYEIDGSQGHGVVIRTNEMFDYGDTQAYFKSIFWHMCDSTKEPQYRSPIEPYISINGPGKPVKAGDLIGYADTTGLSTGDHLHFGLKPCLQGEPSGIWYNVLQDNGYMGAIDAEPYFNGKFAADINNPHYFNFDLSYGMNGQDVIALQTCLQNGGYFPKEIQPNGYFGPVTKSSVQRYQGVNGISKTGYVGPLTRAKLNIEFSK